jgi:hypothetical protein
MTPIKKDKKASGAILKQHEEERLGRNEEAPIRCCTRVVKVGSKSLSVLAVTTTSFRPRASAAACASLVIASASG